MAIFLINYIKDSCLLNILQPNTFFTWTTSRKKKVNTLKNGGGEIGMHETYAFDYHEYIVGIQLKAYWSFTFIFYFFSLFCVMFPNL